MAFKLFFPSLAELFFSLAVYTSASFEPAKSPKTPPTIPPIAVPTTGTAEPIAAPIAVPATVPAALKFACLSTCLFISIVRCLKASASLTSCICA